MNKLASLSFALLPFVLLGACAAEAPAPAPDPAKVEKLLAQLESQAQAAEPAPAPAGEARLPQAAEEKLDKADRLVGSIEKMPSDRLDPSLAEALIAR